MPQQPACPLPPALTGPSPRFGWLTWLVLCLLPMLMPRLATAQEVMLRLTLPDEVVALDRPALEALPNTSFETTTIWSEGVQSFRGVRMTDLLAHFGVEGGTLRLIAANDYAVDIPVDSFTPDGGLLAHERNGAPMTLRSKGPLWLVYPYDSSPKFRSEVIYSNSIWQLDRIVVLPEE